MSEEFGEASPAVTFPSAAAVKPLVEGDYYDHMELYCCSHVIVDGVVVVITS